MTARARWAGPWSSDTLPRVLAMFGMLCVGIVSSNPAPAYECLIEPSRRVEIRSPVEGLIVNINVDRGDAVEAGQILVELDASVEQAQLQVAKFRAEMNGPVTAARNRLLYAQKKVARFDSLAGNSFVSAQQRDEAEAETRVAEAEVVDAVETKELARFEYLRAKALLEQRTLRSPFSGYVAERNLSPGDLADPNASSQPILRLSELDPLKVVVTMPMELFARVKVGSTMHMKTEAGQEFEQLVVASVDAEIDAKSGTFRVNLSLPNPGNTIAAGIGCDASIEEPVALH